MEIMVALKREAGAVNLVASLCKRKPLKPTLLVLSKAGNCWGQRFPKWNINQLLRCRLLVLQQLSYYFSLLLLPSLPSPRDP